MPERFPGQGLVTVEQIDPAGYPGPQDAFSPDEAFPELHFKHTSSRPNPVYRAVRGLLFEAGLDAERFGSPDWNPFGRFVDPGGRVFVLPNFVFHHRSKETKEDFLAKVTHASVLRPILDYALKAVGPKGLVEFGNSPLQSADWAQILDQTGAVHLLRFYDTHAPGQVHARDLRAYIVTRSTLGWQRPPTVHKDRQLHVDLDRLSLLENLDGNHEYRVAQYNPADIKRYQNRNTHVYAVSNNIAAADLVISVPKLKTHEKVGITTAIKGCVGTIALKQSLAHHRKGSPRHGGDEYPSWHPFQRMVSELSDLVWTSGESFAVNVGRVVERVSQVALRRLGQVTLGAWPRNETAWRMAADLARCVAHVSTDGIIRREHVRHHLVLTDGIIAGERLGPLKPTPFRTGLLLYASDPWAADVVNARVMGFDPAQISLTGKVPQIAEYGITELMEQDLKVRFRGRGLSMEETGRLLPRPFMPAPHWENLLAKHFKGA